jgi:hypothetical protein
LKLSSGRAFKIESLLVGSSDDKGEGIHVMRFENRIINEGPGECFGANSAESFSGFLIYHPVCANKEGGLFSLWRSHPSWPGGEICWPTHFPRDYSDRL